jgi:hypothetical protein
MTMYHDTQHPNIVSSHNMKTTTHDDMDSKDGSEEPPGRWQPSPSEMEMDVDVDSEDEVDRHLHIDNDDDHDGGDDTIRTRPANIKENIIGCLDQSDVKASTTSKIGIAGTSDSHARTEVGSRKKTWFNRLPFRRQIEPPAPALPLSGAESALDPHRLPLPRSRSRSRPQSRASTPLTLPPLLPSHREEDERSGSDGESEGEGEKMCRICFTGEDSDSEDDASDSEAEGDAEDDDQDQDRAQGQEKFKTAIRDVEQKKQKRKDQGPGSGSGLGLGRLISPCLCRGSMRVSSFDSCIRCQVSRVRFFERLRWGVRLGDGSRRRCWVVGIRRGC